MRPRISVEVKRVRGVGNVYVREGMGIRIRAVRISVCVEVETVRGIADPDIRETVRVRGG